MRSVAWLIGLLGAAALAQTGEEDRSLGQGPEPSPVPISWEFEFKFEDPQRIEVRLPGRDEPEVYWYVVYTIINTSDTTQHCFPQFEIVTEQLRVLETDMGISPLVFDAIKARHRGVYRYLVPPSRAQCDLKTGDDNALESVAVWRGADLTSNSFSLFVSGLSGENRLIANPAYDAAAGPKIEKQAIGGVEREVDRNPKFFTLRKTLRIDYSVPGSAEARREMTPARQAMRWVMR